MRGAALWLMIRPSRGEASGAVLPLIAFGVIASIVFTVAALARQFWLLPAAGFDGYRILAVALLAVLLVPVATLGAAAARLSVRRRDDRLATLRLLGASPSWVRRVALVETGLIATAGTVLGLAGYSAVTPSLLLVPVAGRSVSLAALWVPPVFLVVLGGAVVLVAVVSAGSGLRQVVISPLGVRARTDAPRLHWLRLAVAGLVVVAGFAVLQFTSTSWGAIGITVAMIGVLVAIMAVQNLAGPFLIGLAARRKLATSTGAADLIAARTLLESPKAAWRQVSSVAMASFVVVPAGSVLGFLSAVQNGPSVLTAQQVLFFGDIRIVVVAAVAVSALLAACAIGITQAAGVIERRDLYVSLDRLGMPLAAMEAARRMAVMIPVRIAVIGSAAVATIIAIPVVAISVFTAPLFIFGVLVCIAASIWIVRLGVTATIPVLRSVLAHPERAL